MDTSRSGHQDDRETHSKKETVKILRVFLPGDFEDAYVYMGWLIILTSRHSLQLYNMEQAANSIDASYPEASPVARYFFARNDWFRSGPFRAIMSHADLAKPFWRSTEAFPASLDASPHFALASEYDLGLKSSVILDLACYGGRLYIGSSDGFYDVSVDWRNPSFDGRPRKRLDARCLSLSARFGVVNASCGGEGLFAGIGEVNGNGAGGDGPMRKLATASLRTGWLHYDIVNYATNAAPSLFPTRHEKTTRQEAADIQLVTSIQSTPFHLDYLLNAIEQQTDDSDSSVQFVFNSSSVIFAQTTDGEIFSLGMRSQEGTPPGIAYSRSFKGARMRILGAHVCKPGAVIEADDSVLLLAEGQWTELLSSPVLTVRTFERSKRFRNLVAITTEEGLWLLSIVNEKASHL
jgi:hypothetical protein